MNTKLLNIKTCFLTFIIIFLHLVEKNINPSFSDYYYFFGVLFMCLMDLINHENFYIIDITIFSLSSILVNNYGIKITNPIFLIFIISYLIILIHTQFKKFKIICYAVILFIFTLLLENI